MANKIIVTTGDLRLDYEVLGLVYFQGTKLGLDSDHYDKLHYDKHMEQLFYTGVEELKRKCHSLGGDAVICVREDVDVLNYATFVRMYGTAVRFVR